MVQLVFQMLFVIGIVPLVLAVLWLLGVPYTRRSAQPDDDELHPERSRALSDILNAKGIPHTLDLWGQDVDHDWPWWRKVVPHYFGRLFG
jgi:esterase/lipase superfamily enzyme